MATQLKSTPFTQVQQSVNNMTFMKIIIIIIAGVSLY